MSEAAPTCRIHEKYEWIECANAARSGDPDGNCILHSEDKGKDPEGFKAALRARFEQAEADYYDFRGVFFPGRFAPEDFFDSREFTKPADFSGATFTEEADFSAAIFTERAVFSEATFTERANFFGATFRELADFFGATFTQAADFFGATFTQTADFTWAIFTEGADFTWATFTERADFIRATIGGRVVFRALNPPKQDEQLAAPFHGGFQGLEFQEKGALRFQDVSLALCAFTGADLRRPEFHHVTWGSRRGRQIIYDEVQLREDEKETPWYWDWVWSRVSGHLPLRTFALEIGPAADTTGHTGIAAYLTEEPAPPELPWGDRYGEVERLYRYLKINYETENDYKNAGDFHYGEMEMHRRAAKWRWFPFYWYNLYWFLSGYGERPSRAFGLLIFFLAVLTGLLAWAGLEILDPKHTPAFGDSFFYLLQKVTLQRPTWAEPVGFWGNLVAGFSVLLLPGQAALFILALRNRLGRRR